MPEKKENKNDSDIKVKQPTDVSVNITYTNDEAVHNGSVTSSSFTEDGKIDVTTVSYTDEQGNTYTEESISKIKDPAPGLNLDDLRAIQKENGGSTVKTYEYLMNYIKENKDNPQIIQNTISKLLSNFSAMYDSDKTHAKVGSNQLEVWDKILNTEDGNELDSFICGTIHDSIGQLLEDCGIESAIISGGQVGGGEHATLLYKLEDGRYVFNNYGKSITIEAPNIKEALQDVYKKSGILESAGMLQIMDKDNSSYQEFAFRKEAAFGDEFDKREYNGNSPLDNTLKPNSEINASVNVSTTGNIRATAEGTLAYGNENVIKNTTVSAEFRRSGETDYFYQSQSEGLKVEHNAEIQKNPDTSFTYNVKGIVSHTSGEFGSVDYVQLSTLSDNNGQTRASGNPEQNLVFDKGTPNSRGEYLSMHLNGSVGLQKTLVENDNLKLTNATQASGVLYGTLGLNKDVNHSKSFDGRFALENGFGLGTKSETFSTQTNVSGGVVMDAVHTCDGFRPTFGAKLNVSTGFNYTPNDNLQLGAEARACGVFTQASQDYGISGNVTAGYRPDGSNVTIFGSAGAGLTRQNLSTGLFNQQTENNLASSIAIGAKWDNKSVSVGYNNFNNKLNPTENLSNISVTARFTF